MSQNNQIENDQQRQDVNKCQSNSSNQQQQITFNTCQEDDGRIIKQEEQQLSLASQNMNPSLPSNEASNCINSEGKRNADDYIIEESKFQKNDTNNLSINPDIDNQNNEKTIHINQREQYLNIQHDSQINESQIGESNSIEKIEGISNSISQCHQSQEEEDIFESQSDSNQEQLSIQTFTVKTPFNEDEFKQAILKQQGIKLNFIKDISTQQLLQKICSILKTCEKIERPYRFNLEATSMQWNKNCVLPLCQQLILFPNLIGIQLNLSKNRVNKFALQQIGMMIKQTVNVRFWEIDLSYNDKLENNGHIILQDLCELKYLEKVFISLSYTTQTSKCAEYAAEIVKNNKKTIKHINFQFRCCFQIGNQSLFQLLQQVLEVSTIFSFGIGIDVIEIEDCTSKLLIEVLKKYNKIQNLILHLSQCGITPKRFKQIAAHIQKMDQLIKLEFGCQRSSFDNSTFINLLNILKDKVHLTDLSLDFYENSLNDQSLHALSQSISQLPKLIYLKLNISNNKFGNSAIELASVLKNKNIKGVLEMRNCKIPQDIVYRVYNSLNMQLQINQK